MSTLIVNYYELSSLTSTAQSLSKKISTRINDYDSIRNKIRDMSGSSNLSQANYFIQKKNQKLQEKKDKIDSFIARVKDFKAEAAETDKRVARRIESDTRTFKKVNNISITVFNYIGIGFEAAVKSWFGRDTVNTLSRFGRNIKYVIKDFYHDMGGKYVVNVIKDFALLAISVAAVIIFPPAGIVAGIFAGFAIYNATATLIYDVAALSDYIKTGNRSIADATDEKDGKDATRFIFGGVAGVVGGDEEFWADVGGFLHSGMSVAALLYSLGKDFKDLKSAFTEYNKFDGSFFSKGLKALKKTYLTPEFTPASDVKMSGIFRFQSYVQKLIPSFSTNAAKKVAELIWMKDNMEAVTGINDYVNFIDFNWTLDSDRWELKVPDYFKDIWDTGEDFVESVGDFKDNKPTRLPPIKDMSNFKIPVANLQPI